MTARALVARHSDLALSGPLGSLDAYLERVSRIPVLSREDEQALARRFRQDGDVGGRTLETLLDGDHGMSDAQRSTH